MLLQNTLNYLKKESALTILLDDGTTTRVKFKFNQPATEKELKKLPCDLPNEYKEFLLVHNGAQLYEDLEDCGDGFELFSVDEILLHYSYYNDWPKGWFPIGAGFDGDLLIIAPNKDRQGYMCWMETGDSFEEPNYIGNLKFDEWFNYFCIAQGSKFWEWY
ncbi:SMI1/KNR4 family protein [Halalkalibacterium halodurans]|uniref:Knr4/Smi1-like domain-containing protein n=1 Tax=Halalkalibacterium halodurans TaxID=86665 RepID=A0A0M0KIG6_ALKHA|nr:SMI1/KNR4 family protein [Halalkalibacterium halodurans]MDY7223265.1 SMI1/KNR4 family protein [Halalkalibacterium halodurans]MDY7242486.1 SMI1/KNR4 family protein [Halalkalibacterium halodurans]TPE69408.1 SMI1/KNR4 family protein [Halalkalibacterium halodurans]